MTVHSDQLCRNRALSWLCAELETLEELQRIDAPGLPRAIFSTEKSLCTWQPGFELHNLTSGQRFELSADLAPAQ